jgi:transposase
VPDALKPLTQHIPLQSWVRMSALDATLWNFVTVPGVDPANNAAERALRHPVIWHRTSHGTQADKGSLSVQ